MGELLAALQSPRPRGLSGAGGGVRTASLSGRAGSSAARGSIGIDGGSCTLLQRMHTGGHALPYRLRAGPGNNAPTGRRALEAYPKCVVKGTSVPVRVDVGGGGII